MLIVDYQSKSYQHFLNDLGPIAKHKTRLLITLNGGTESDLRAVSEDFIAQTNNSVQNSTVIADKASEEIVDGLFSEARSNRNILVFKNSDVSFDKKAAVKKSHERETSFNLNNLFKNIAKHNGIVALATDKKQTLSASMSTKVDVLVRFPNA